MGMVLVHPSPSLLPTHHIPSAQLLLPSADACYNPTYKHLSLVSMFISFQTCEVYFPEKVSLFLLMRWASQGQLLDPNRVFWGACKRQAWYWSPAERFFLLLPQDCMLAVWMGLYSLPPHKIPCESQTLPRIYTESIAGCHLVQLLAQQRINLDHIAYGICPKNRIFEAISLNTCCICSLSCMQMSSPGPVSFS